MRIAVVHSFYRSGQPSGENAVVLQQVETLRNAGHEVKLVASYSDEETRKRYSTVRAGANVMLGRGFDPTDRLNNFGPEIVHVHNTFPNISLKWLHAFRNRLVVTLHNFRTVCANGLLFRDGRVCLECPTQSAMAGLLHGCYRNSRLATLPLTIRNSKGPGKHPLLSEATAIVCLSHKALDLFRAFGVDRSKLMLVPNGISQPSTGQSTSGNGRWAFAGRLSSEKGILELVDSWPPGESLDIYGDGPLKAAIENLHRPGVRLCGALGRRDLIQTLSEYQGLVFPSSCFEMQPTVVLEALAGGVPVIAKRENAGGEIVFNYNCGATYGSSESIDDAMKYVKEQGLQLRRRSRLVFEEFFTQAAWLERQLLVYSEVMRNS